MVLKVDSDRNEAEVAVVNLGIHLYRQVY